MIESIKWNSALSSCVYHQQLGLSQCGQGVLVTVFAMKDAQCWQNNAAKKGEGPKGHFPSLFQFISTTY